MIRMDVPDETPSECKKLEEKEGLSNQTKIINAEKVRFILYRNYLNFKCLINIIHY